MTPAIVTASGPTGPNFVTEPDAFDVIFLAGMQNPGICKVNCPKKHDLDKKKSKGSKGGTVTSTGDPLVDFSVEYYLWLPAHFDAWPGFAAMQRKTLKIPASGGATGNVRQANAPVPIATPGKIQPVAMDCFHPDLAAINVLRCVLEEEGSPTPDGKGGRHYTWKYCEYNPPAPSGGTISSSVSGQGAGSGGKATEATAQTAADRMLHDCLAKARGLGLGI